MPEKYCPICMTRVKSVGYVCTGHTIYYCHMCNKKFEIKELAEESEYE